MAVVRIIVFSLFGLFSSFTIMAQSGDQSFKVQSSALGDEMMFYSPVQAGSQWFYTKVSNEAVLQKTVPASVDIPIAGLLLKSNVITGYSKAGATGLTAISFGRKDDIVRNRVKKNKIWFAYQDKLGMLAKYFEFAVNSEDYSCTTPYLTPDGTQMYFASDMPGGYGGFDIYVCDYRGKEWTKPRNVGPLINTSQDEIFPYKDGDMMLFSSNGHSDQGMDILIADMDNGRGRIVFNPGVPVNSPADDYAMTFDSEHSKGFLVSDRSGSSGQLYSVENIKKLLLLNIRSLDDKRSLGGARIDMSRCRRASFYTNANGSMILPVEIGENCFINIDKIGYTSTSLKLDYNGIKGLKKSVDILLAKEGLFYDGLITDADGRPAQEIQVTIVDQASGDIQISYTDDKGIYRAALEPLSYYLIRTSNQYFNQSETKVATLANFPAGVLGTIKLQGNGRKRPGIGAVTPRTEEVTSEQNTTIANVLDEKERLTVEQPKETKPINSPQPMPTPVNEGEKATVRFAIQLAAIAGDYADLTGYQAKLQPYGKVYSVRENNMTKVRLGFFNSQEDAKMMIIKLPAEYKKSFIVQENNTIETTVPTTKTVVASSVPPTSVAAPEKTPTEYKIRLSTLKDPKLFNGANLKELGLIEEVKSGNLVTFYLSGFENLDEVRRVLPAVKNQGFTTAHIVSFANGEYSKVE